MVRSLVLKDLTRPAGTTRFLPSKQARKLTKRGQENASPARCNVMDEMRRRPKSRERPKASCRGQDFLSLPSSG
jgi:hypothetical protein